MVLLCSPADFTQRGVTLQVQRANPLNKHERTDWLLAYEVDYAERGVCVQISESLCDFCRKKVGQPGAPGMNESREGLHSGVFKNRSWTSFWEHEDDLRGRGAFLTSLRARGGRTL